MKILNKRAFSIIEYMFLIVIIVGAFMLLRGNIQRGIYGMWQKLGASFAFGRQYDSQKSVECEFDEQSNRWYDRNCFEQYVANLNPPCNSGDTSCEENVILGCVTANLSMCGPINNTSYSE